MQKLKGGKMKNIVRNRIKCSKCNDVIESRHQHDFKWCKCKTVFVDGGNAYWRCGGDLSCIIRIYDDENEEYLLNIEGEKVKDPDSEPIDINDLLFYNIRSN